MTRPKNLPLRGVTEGVAHHLPKILPILLPAVLAVSMALIFRHPAMLMFGLIGPVLALTGSWGKKREQAHHNRAREDQERDQEQQRQRDLQQKTDAWRGEQLGAHPAVTDWLHNPLWRPEQNTPDVTVRVGLGVVVPPAESGIHQPVSGVPLTIPLHTNLAVVGSGADAAAVWRAVACQALALMCGSGNTPAARVSVAGLWAHNADVPALLTIPDPSSEHHNSWYFVDTAHQVPPQATWVLVVTGRGVARIFHRGVVAYDDVQSDTVTFAESRWVRARLVDTEERPSSQIPTIEPGDRYSLWAGVAADQPAINLVDQGPHSLVWGKTGSGKSVLLHRLVGSVCARYSPEQVALVGIDFKGGATLAPLMAYPHAAGLLTDLSPLSITRVTASLRAEILRREQLFADHRVANWPDLPADVSCPRVLIVVDEAGVVAHEAPELMAVLSDIASRGRSLGLHLVISTQRPQHVPRNIVANCALRLCLGVTDADEASHYAPDIPRHLLHKLRHSPPGTVVIPGLDGSYTLATVDTAHPEVSWPGHNQRPLWREDLPEVITAPELAVPGEVPSHSHLLGVADYPDRQSQEPWVYQPGTHGPLIIVGESGSGHTTCLTHLASEAGNRHSEVVWASGVASVMVSQLMSIQNTAHPLTPMVFIVDRLDRTLQGVPPDGQAWILDNLDILASQLSERGDGSTAVITTAPGSSVAGALSRWNATRCLLRHRDASQWAMAAGLASLHDPAAPAGRAVVGSVALQWCYPGRALPPAVKKAQVQPTPEGVVVIAPSQHHTSAGVWWSPSEAEGRWREVTHAISHGPGVVCSGIPPQQMRQWCGPGHTTPPVVAAWPYGWHLHPGGAVLVSCEP